MCGSWQRQKVHRTHPRRPAVDTVSFHLPHCCLGLLGGLARAVGAVLGPVLHLTLAAAEGDSGKMRETCKSQAGVAQLNGCRRGSGVPPRRSVLAVQMSSTHLQPATHSPAVLHLLAARATPQAHCPLATAGSAYGGVVGSRKKELCSPLACTRPGTSAGTRGFLL